MADLPDVMTIQNMNEQKIKIGDMILIEEAWEDEAGQYHDEYAKVVNIDENGYMKLKFRMDEITDFLSDAEFHVSDYQNNIEE